jgi:hypothetical protein
MPSLVLLAFSPNKLTWHLPYFQSVLFSKTGAKTLLQAKALPRLCIFLKLKGYSVVIPLFYKTTILSTFDKWSFKTPLRKLVKGDDYVSICF